MAYQLHTYTQAQIEVICNNFFEVNSLREEKIFTQNLCLIEPCSSLKHTYSNTPKKKMKEMHVPLYVS